MIALDVRTHEENELFTQTTFPPNLPHSPVPMSWFVLPEILLPTTLSHTQLSTPKIFLLPAPELLVTFKMVVVLNSVEVSPTIIISDRDDNDFSANEKRGPDPSGKCVESNDSPTPTISSLSTNTPPHASSSVIHSFIFVFSCPKPLPTSGRSTFRDDDLWLLPTIIILLDPLLPESASIKPEHSMFDKILLSITSTDDPTTKQIVVLSIPASS